MEFLFWCQQEVWNKAMCHPVGLDREISPYKTDLGDSGTKKATMHIKNIMMAHMPWKLYHSSARYANRPVAIAPEDEKTCDSYREY